MTFTHDLPPGLRVEADGPVRFDYPGPTLEEDYGAPAGGGRTTEALH